MPQSILIIEDDAAVRTSMALGLADAGFDVLEAAEAAAAMGLFLRAAPDLVLLDLGIGGEDGMVLLRNMKKVRPATPVVIVSGRTHISDAIEAFKAGAWDYVTKPIASLEVFINGLRNCLAQTRLHQRVQDTQEQLFRLVQNLPVIIFIILRVSSNCLIKLFTSVIFVPLPVAILLRLVPVSISGLSLSSGVID